jgi:hypothetical protein
MTNCHIAPITTIGHAHAQPQKGRTVMDQLLVVNRQIPRRRGSHREDVEHAISG